MDRGNRRNIITTSLVVLPVALLIGSQVFGAPPVGKQPRDNQSRSGGLLQIFTGESKTQPSSRSKQSSKSTKPKKGVGPATVIGNFVKALREDDSDLQTSNAKPSASQHRHQTQAKPNQRALSQRAASQRSASQRSASVPATQQQSPDWNGVPFHQPIQPGNKVSRAPIRDPQAGGAAPRRSQSVLATPASARRPSSPPSIMESDDEPELSVIEPENPRVLPAPVASPPALIEPILSEATTSVPLSESSSSRRQNRRQVGPLKIVSTKQNVTAETEPELSQVDPAPEQPKQELKPETQQPKIARRELPAQEKPEQEAEATPADEATTAKSQPVETKEPAKQLAPLPEPAPTAVEAIAKQPVPSAEVAVRPAPAKSSSVPSAPVPSAPVPSATGPVAAETGSPAASTLSPPAPVTTPQQAVPTPSQPPHVPMAGVPNRKFASIPSEPASHRAGPPTSAFQPRHNITPVPAPGTTTINPASTPIGSGVAPTQSGVFRKPDYNPAFGHQPGYAPVHRGQDYASDPYASNGFAPIQPRNQASSALNNPVVPMHPIADHIATAPGEHRYDNRNYGNSVPQPAATVDTRTPRPGETAVESELPGIRVVTHGPSSIMIRQTHQFEIRVENRGSIDAEGVMVRALIPDWAEVRGQTASRGDIEPQINGTSERLVWTIDQLPAGATERMFVRLKAERSGTHGLDVDWTLVPKKSVAKIHVHQPKLELAIEGPSEVVYGESQTYKVRVLNPGDGVAPNVVFTLSPNSATPQTQRIGNIPSGKEAQFEVELTAQDLGDLKIHGLASGDLELRAEATKTIRVAAAKLEAVLTGPQLKYQDTDAQYHLQIQNNGVATSQQIVATLRLPAGAKYLGGLDGATLRGNVLSWQLDSLTPGAVRDYQFKCKMTSPGDQMFMFDCKGTAAGIADVAINTRVESIADLVLTINDPAAPAPVGGEVVYEIVIKNRGSKEATDVRAIAQFSHGIEPLRIEGHTGQVLTGQVLFEAIERIGPGQEVRMKVIAKADRAGHHRFHSEVRSGDTVLVAEEATHYMSQRSDRVSRRSGEGKIR